MARLFVYKIHPTEQVASSPAEAVDPIAESSKVKEECTTARREHAAGIEQSAECKIPQEGQELSSVQPEGGVAPESREVEENEKITEIKKLENKAQEVFLSPAMSVFNSKTPEERVKLRQDMKDQNSEGFQAFVKEVMATGGENINAWFDTMDQWGRKKENQEFLKSELWEAGSRAVSGGVFGMFLPYYINGSFGGIKGAAKAGMIGAGIAAVFDPDLMKGLGRGIAKGEGYLWDGIELFGSVLNNPIKAFEQARKPDGSIDFDRLWEYSQTGLTAEQRAAGMKPLSAIERNLPLGGALKALAWIWVNVLLVTKGLAAGKGKDKLTENKKPTPTETVEPKQREELVKHLEKNNFNDVVGWMVKNGIITKSAKKELERNYTGEKRKQFVADLQKDGLGSVQQESEIRDRFWTQVKKQELSQKKEADGKYFETKSGVNTLKKKISELNTDGKIDSQYFDLVIKEGENPEKIKLTEIKKTKKPTTGELKFLAHVENDPKELTFVLVEKDDKFYLEGGSNVSGAGLKKDRYEIRGLSSA